MRLHFWIPVAIAAAGCAEDLRPDQPDAGDLGDDGGGASHVVHTEHGDGTTTTQVDATDEAAWVYLELEAKAEVAPETPDDSPAWDLGFQRYKIVVNGGVSGAGAMEVAALPGADFDALTTAPADGYLTDAADSDDEDAEPDRAFDGGDGWYAYDPVTHVLSPHDVLYVVRSVEGGYYKLRMLDYYDDAGTSGFPTFQWGPIAAPAGSDALVVDASDQATWTYVSVAGGVVTATDASTSDAWDLAFNRTRIRSNSGSSGGRLGGARLAPDGATYETTTTATTIGYAVDAMIPVPGPPGSGEYSGNPVLDAWFAYDSVTHSVTSKQAVYLVRTAAGDHARLQITGYAGGVFTLRLAPVAREVTVQTTTVAATSTTAWVYLDLLAGAEVAIVDPAASHGWDLAFRRTSLASNSGTSGPGAGGVADPGAQDLAAVVATTGSYTVDAMLPVAGPPGSGDYSGNPTLAAWYDYDPTTHVVSPRDKVFLVRTADGGFVKLEITGYTGGSYTIDWAYAGAGRADFGAAGGGS